MSKENAVSTNMIDYSADAGAGFQEARSDSYSLPFFRILQALSPQTKKSDGAYVVGAEEGKFILSSTNQIFDGTSGVIVVPCHFTQRLVERKTRENGRNFVAEHLPDATMTTTEDTKGRDILPNGNELIDVRTHYCLLLAEYPKSAPAIPIVISLNSTQRRKSRKWMSIMQGIVIDTPNGPATAPMFSHTYRVRTVPEKNDQGSWFGWSIELVDKVLDPLLYAQAKAFASVVRSGQATADRTTDQE